MSSHCDEYGLDLTRGQKDAICEAVIAAEESGALAKAQRMLSDGNLWSANIQLVVFDAIQRIREALGGTDDD